MKTQYIVGRLFVDLEIEEELDVRGLYYDNSNNDAVLYLHLVNASTAGEIVQGVINPNKMVEFDIPLCRESNN